MTRSLGFRIQITANTCACHNKRSVWSLYIDLIQTYTVACRGRTPVCRLGARGLARLRAFWHTQHTRCVGGSTPWRVEAPSSAA